VTLHNFQTINQAGIIGKKVFLGRFPQGFEGLVNTFLKSGGRNENGH